MKKLTLLVAFTMLVSVAFSNGLLTNTNQSAQFIRMMSRNASLGIDGVYYNPAGLVKLENGWHFSVNSQTIFQNKIIDSQFPWLNDGHYEGTVQVPVFPTGFAVYKKDKLALSFGFGPNAGGGSATFDRGLPSFEIPITKVVPALAPLTMIDPSLAVSGYDAKLAFDGSSIFWGFQVGASYALNEKLSVSAGVRYLPATNKYQGSIKDVALKVGDQYYPAPAWLTQTATAVSGIAAQAAGGAAQYASAAQMASGASAQLEAAINAGLIGANDPLTDPTIIAAMQQFGVDPTGFTNAITVGALNQTAVALNSEADNLNAAAGQLNATATTLNQTSGSLGDREVDTEQTGNGITPILGLNFSPNDKLNIAVKYEHKTTLTLTNNTTVDDLGLFPDGQTSASDLPGILSLGIGYTDNYWFETQLSYTMFFDKDVDWGANVRDVAIWKDLDPTQIRAREIDKNGYEIGLGFQFNITDKFSVSTGGLLAKPQVADSFQSDFSYANQSFTLGGGIMWKVTDQLTLDAGLLNVFYKDAEVRFVDPHAGPYNETYTKEAFTFAVGLSYSIF